MFSHIIHSFIKNWIIHQLEKSFSKLFFALFLSLIFILIYGFSEVFWLNLITLWTFSRTNLWFNAYFKFLMWITFLVLSFKLEISFSTFSIFILSGKNGKLLWSSWNFSRYWTSALRKYPSLFFITVFYETFIDVRSIFDLLTIIYWKLLRRCPTI